MSLEGARPEVFGNGGATILLSVGDGVERSGLRDEWVLPHELTHLGFPSVPSRHTWIEEGLATYVEPIARAERGELTDEEVWIQLVRGLPQGLPEEGDRGLDQTHTWGRTYWGGALFCLVADVAIRERTSNRKGLVDALRAIVAAGGNVSVRWPLERALAVGDRAVGVPVLGELYRKMGAAPMSVHLDDLWRRLGVRRRGRGVSFDDAAPLAAVRRAMISRR